MSADSSQRALQETTRELLDVLRDVERAVEPPDARRLIRPPTPRGLLEFTSEVGIPAAILVLRTNIAVLELLQRSLRMVGDVDRPDSAERGLGARATDLTTSSLARLDDALADLQTAIDGRAIDRSPDELLAEARERTEELEAQLANRENTNLDEFGQGTATTIDVEAELDSLRKSVDDADGSDDPNRGSSDR